MLTPELEILARQLADDIRDRRNGLANEDALAEGVEHRSCARAKKWRDQDRAMIKGMVIALTHILGRPLDMQLAEEFIAGTSTWRAML